MKQRRRILFVAMQSSPHVARWIDSLAGNDLDLHFFPINSHDSAPELHGVTMHQPVMPDLSSEGLLPPPDPYRPPARERVRRFVALLRSNPSEAVAVARRKIARLLPDKKPVRSSDTVIETPVRVSKLPFTPTLEQLGGREAVNAGMVLLGESDEMAPVLHGPGVLASVIENLKPDLIHSMEFQHCGYLALAAKDRMGTAFPPWLATNWGSDIFYFQRFEDHLSQIKRLLNGIDYYSCECHRDIRLAEEHGFEGVSLPVLPNSGGFNMDRINRIRSDIPPSQRKTIMLKCYDHFAGRGMMVLDVVDRFKDRLKDYQVVLFSLGARPRERAVQMKQEGELDIKIIDWAPHEDILAHFARARLYMAISISDGVSTSSLEAMAMGAFPIQTMTACCDEWFDDGIGGFHTDPDDFEMICDRFQRALQDDDLVDNAAAINARTVDARLDQKVVTPKINAFYDMAWGSGPLAESGASKSPREE